MTSNTQTIEASKLREILDDTYLDNYNKVDELRKLVTPPSMADTTWDSRKHHGAEVLHESGALVLMIAPLGAHSIDCQIGDGTHMALSPSLLTPTGRKAKLVLEEEEAKTEWPPTADDAGNPLHHSPTGMYKDQDGDLWEHIDGNWEYGDTPIIRREKRARSGADCPKLPATFGPYNPVVA